MCFVECWTQKIYEKIIFSSERLDGQKNLFVFRELVENSVMNFADIEPHSAILLVQ